MGSKFSGQYYYRRRYHRAPDPEDTVLPRRRNLRRRRRALVHRHRRRLHRPASAITSWTQEVDIYRSKIERSKTMWRRLFGGHASQRDAQADTATQPADQLARSQAPMVTLRPMT